MTNFTVTRVAFCLLGILVVTTECRRVIKSGLHNSVDPAPNLVFIGRTGNKAFFGDRDETYTRLDAKLHCESMNMRLASVITAEERDVLLNATYIPNVFHGWYWLNARDSFTPSQLVWDGLNKPVDVDLPMLYGLSHLLEQNDFQTCMAYYIDETRKGFGFVKCGATNGYVICES